MPLKGEASNQDTAGQGSHIEWERYRTEMNILSINHYAGSVVHGMEYRPFFMAREWQSLGHDVVVVAASFSHLHSKPPQVQGRVTAEQVEGIPYLWYKTPAYEGNTLRRALNTLVFAWRIRRDARRLARQYRPDIVVASSPHPFIIYGARKIARLAGAKLVFEVRDLWPLSLVELSGIKTSHPFIVAMQWAEDYAYRHSDRVVSLLPKTTEHMMAHGMAREKFLWVPNGIVVADWESLGEPLPEEHVRRLDELQQQGRFLVGYAGNHGVANALETLIDGAAKLSDKPLAVVLVGQGPEKENLQAKAQQAGLTNVEFLPPVPRAAVPNLLAKFDALYISLKSEPLFRFGISPNKLIDYMMAAKPVIQSIDAGNDMVTDNQCGISIRPEDPDAVADAISKLMEMSPEQRQALGDNGSRYVRKNHDYGLLAKRFLEGLGGEQGT